MSQPSERFLFLKEGLVMIKEIDNLEDVKVGDKFIVKTGERIYGYGYPNRGIWLERYANIEVLRITPKKTKWIVNFDGREKEFQGTRVYTGNLRLNLTLLTFEECDRTEIESINEKFISVKRIINIAKKFDIKIDENKVLELSDDKRKSISLDIADLFNNLNQFEKERD